MTGAMLDRARVEQAIGDFPDPETGRSVLATGQILAVDVAGERVSVTLGLTTHSAPLWNETCGRLRDQLATRLPSAGQITVQRGPFERPPTPLGSIQLTAKSVVAVGSGKGGVGKSTIAASIALALQRFGCRAGLMDADVYGPSIPHLLGLDGRPEVTQTGIQPMMFESMPVMSMGFFVPKNEAVIWRGPKLHGAITQFLRDTNWGPLDYLIIDLPPGTGDIALTLSQTLPLSGAVVVCTPQEVALLDAVKAIAMFRTVNIPVLGMVENMSGFVCPDNGKRYDIFGKGGARQCAEKLEVPFLGDVPITISIRENGDAGQTVANFTDLQVAPYLEKIAYQLARHLADRAAAGSVPGPLPSL